MKDKQPLVMNTTLKNSLLETCENIEKKGLTPSVALLRAKAATQVSLPQAISVIKAYQSGERYEAISDETLANTNQPEAPDTNASVEQRLRDLEQQNQTLSNRVLALEKQLASYLVQLNSE